MKKRGNNIEPCGTSRSEVSVFELKVIQGQKQYLILDAVVIMPGVCYKTRT